MEKTQEPTEKKGVFTRGNSVCQTDTKSKLRCYEFSLPFSHVYGDTRTDREKESSLPFPRVYGDTRADREKESSLPCPRVYE